MSTSRDVDAAALKELLLADHDHIRRLIEEFTTAVHAGDWEQCDAVFRKVEDLADRHFTFEEEELFPVFDEHPEVFSCGTTNTSAMRTEHAAIRTMLSEIGIGLQLHSVREPSVRRLVATVQAHALQEDQWAESLAKCAEAASEAPPSVFGRLRALIEKHVVSAK